MTFGALRVYRGNLRWLGNHKTVSANESLRLAANSLYCSAMVESCPTRFNAKRINYYYYIFFHRNSYVSYSLLCGVEEIHTVSAWNKTCSVPLWWYCDKSTAAGAVQRQKQKYLWRVRIWNRKNISIICESSIIYFGTTVFNSPQSCQN